MWHIMEMLQSRYTLTEQLTRHILQTKNPYKAQDNILDVVEELLENGADANGMPGGTFMLFPIHAAAKVGNAQVIEALINHGADPNLTDSLGRAPLHYAAESSTKAVKILLKHKAQPNVRGTDMNTPLHWASYKNNSASVLQLLQHGATVNALNLNNDTPLSFAAMRGNAECLQILLDYGADVSIENVHGKTAFMRIALIQLTDIRFPGDDLSFKLLLNASGQILIKPNSLQYDLLKHDNDLLNLYKKLSAQPLPLTSLCRKSIRNSLVNRFLPDALKLLRLPRFVQDFILLRDCL